MKKKTKTNIRLAAAGVVASALAGAGAYYFYGSKKAKQHRTETIAWMKKAEKEILSRAKKLKKEALNSAAYKQIVAEVSEQYKALEHVDAKDVQDFAKTLLASWKDIEKDLVKKVSGAQKIVKKITAKSRK